MCEEAVVVAPLAILVGVVLVVQEEKEEEDAGGTCGGGTDGLPDVPPDVRTDL